MKPEPQEIHAFSVNYLNRDGHEPGTLLNRGFWIHNLPRPVLLCRTLGHKPVVDGSEGFINGNGHRGRGYRWVCCDRCGLRTDPQGQLDPERWNIGDPYDGELPGPWPQPVGALGGQLIAGKGGVPGASIEFAIGCAGDEHTLAGHIRLNPIGALYLHTEHFGSWLQRRLNPTGYDTRVVEFGVGDGLIWWRLWAKQGNHSTSTPRWRDGSTAVDPRDRLFGPVRFSYEPHGDPVTATVRMPDGDDHEVSLQLQRQRRGRRKGRGTYSWGVEWDSRAGIPFRNDSWKGDTVNGFGVDVSDAAVRQDRWAEEACAAIAARVAQMRSRYRWRPAVEVS